MVIFFKKWKKYNEIQLTKNKMDIYIGKMTNHPPSPETIFFQKGSIIFWLLKFLVHKKYILNTNF